MNSCPICAWNLEVGQYVSLPPLGQHTCEHCGYTFALDRTVALYVGLADRGAITHVFISFRPLRCPECGEDISQINMPCGGMGIPVSFQFESAETDR